MGFVGLTIGLILSKKGFSVVGVEKNSKILKSLKFGKAHFFEPGINILLNSMLKIGKLKLEIGKLPWPIFMVYRYLYCNTV